MYDRYDYLKNLEAVCAYGNSVINVKTNTYGDSWKKRGGRGAYYTLVRPMDRLVKMVEENYHGDIFLALEKGGVGDGSPLDALRDLRNYLTLVEAEGVALGYVDLPIVVVKSAVVGAPAPMVTTLDGKELPDWRDSNKYSSGTQVKFNGKVWEAIRDNIACMPTEGVYWRSVGDLTPDRVVAGLEHFSPGTPEDGGHHAAAEPGVKDLTNATFYFFKESGKYYSDARGIVDEATFSKVHRAYDRREHLRELNGGLPGLMGNGDSYIIQVTPDTGLEYGYPLLLLRSGSLVGKDVAEDAGPG